MSPCAPWYLFFMVRASDYLPSPPGPAQGTEQHKTVSRAFPDSAVPVPPVVQCTLGRHPDELRLEQMYDRLDELRDNTSPEAVGERDEIERDLKMWKFEVSSQTPRDRAQWLVPNVDLNAPIPEELALRVLPRLDVRDNRACIEFALAHGVTSLGGYSMRRTGIRAASAGSELQYIRLVALELGGSPGWGDPANYAYNSDDEALRWAANSERCGEERTRLFSRCLDHRLPRDARSPSATSRQLLSTRRWRSNSSTSSSKRSQCACVPMSVAAASSYDRRGAAQSSRSSRVSCTAQVSAPRAG